MTCELASSSFRPPFYTSTTTTPPPETTPTVPVYVPTTSVPEYCSAVYLLSPGTPLTLTSPNYPAEYPNSARCEYTLRFVGGGDDVCHVSMNFIQFDLETGINCKYDYLEVSAMLH